MHGMTDSWNAITTGCSAQLINVATKHFPPVLESVHDSIDDLLLQARIDVRHTKVGDHLVHSLHHHLPVRFGRILEILHDPSDDVSTTDLATSGEAHETRLKNMWCSVRNMSDTTRTCLPTLTVVSGSKTNGRTHYHQTDEFYTRGPPRIVGLWRPQIPESPLKQKRFVATCCVKRSMRWMGSQPN